MCVCVCVCACACVCENVPIYFFYESSCTSLLRGSASQLAPRKTHLPFSFSHPDRNSGLKYKVHIRV